MPHLRQNVVTREWVVFAPERARRPEDFARSAGERTHQRPVYRAECPFCPGHHEPELLRYPAPEGGWQVRGLPNKFPALVPGPRPARVGDFFTRSMEGVGHHEVVVESPRHNTTLALMPPEQVLMVLRAWRERNLALGQLPETDHVVIYKNHGPRAGTSLEHPHSQVVSLPVAPSQVHQRMLVAQQHYDDWGLCLGCQVLEAEVADGRRLVARGRHFTAFVPYAAFSPFFLWIFPHRHLGSFCQTSDEELADLALLLREVLARLYHGLGDPSYNLVLRVPSRHFASLPYLHYYLSVVPRLASVAGFEMGTGMFINTSLPEDDAAYLRGVALP
ncbi:MAG TPA: galactose-1-phosphate uridylyltransferase [Candidatus Nitrosotenuis sp.]|nr:galactose-1-phosphate uridylyltransferase [Candidatus Nitrosotenuis sp.]